MRDTSINTETTTATLATHGNTEQVATVMVALAASTPPHKSFRRVCHAAQMCTSRLIWSYMVPWSHASLVIGSTVLQGLPDRQTRGPRYVTMFVLSSNSPHYTLRVRRALPNFQVIDILN